METADLVLLPYNYLLDPVVRQANKLKLANAIVIFDEGHNLVSHPRHAHRAAALLRVGLLRLVAQS